MFIEKEDRLSHPTLSHRSGATRSAPRRAAPRQMEWDAPRRAPRNWAKLVRVTLYLLLGLLGGVAAVLAGAALLLPAHGPQRPATQHTAMSDMPDGASHAAADPTVPSSPALSAAQAVPPAPPLPNPAPAPSSAPVPAPSATPAPTTAPAPPASVPDATLPAIQDLRQQLKEATAALTNLRAETERLRQGMADTGRQRAVPAETAPAAPASAPPPAPNAGWADAERTVQALGRNDDAPEAAFRPAQPDARAAAPAAKPPPPPAPARTQTAAAGVSAVPTAPPIVAAPPSQPSALPPPPAVRPRVFLHYRGGSAGGMQAATEVAQRLLFSDFAYANTRSAANVPPGSVVRYFFPEDAPAAQRLAALLSDGTLNFNVQDATDRPGRAVRGMLDVWIAR